ncbi:phenoloxidase-activating factor 2 isoform X1 [Temnothorax nylanderi]|uniref:phenoloxidase-activating factor 2 isoform X1 n=2 Tax=Temnothorax nylanderi TaxID=102681 RepID=UPI003A845FF8
MYRGHHDSTLGHRSFECKVSFAVRRVSVFPSGRPDLTQTMWQLVSALTLVGVTLVTALPAAQQNDGSLDALIAQAFPTAKTTPPSVPQIGGDLDSLIRDVFKNGNVSTTTPRNVILGIENKTPLKPADCECVPYYQCKEGKIVENGVGIIDIRSDFGDKDEKRPGGLGPCDNYLDVCCKAPDLLPPVTPPPTSTRTGCGQRHPEGVGFRITGQTDNEAQFGEFPWMVAILKEEAIGANGQKLNVYQCGGALIHRQAVLTAAHCVNGKQPQELKVRAGEWDTQTKNEIYPHQDRDVERVVVHEGFHSGALYNDYAILILKTPIEYAENVDIVCLPEINANFDGSRCFASGWGKDVFGKEGRYQVILKRVELPIVHRDRCQDIMRTTRLGKYFVLDRSFICAGGELGKDTCKGDGGSPLVCPLQNDPTRYVQAGIVAWGLGCGENGTPGVYANIAHARRWIDEQMAFYNLDNSVYQYPN